MTEDINAVLQNELLYTSKFSQKFWQPSMTPLYYVVDEEIHGFI
jgi:hypothetical protein